MTARPSHESKHPAAPALGTPLRCAFCGALLATRERAGVRVRRGHLEVIIDGTFRASVVCYRPHCRRVNVFTGDEG